VPFSFANQHEKTEKRTIAIRLKYPRIAHKHGAMYKRVVDKAKVQSITLISPAAAHKATKPATPNPEMATLSSVFSHCKMIKFTSFILLVVFVNKVGEDPKNILNKLKIARVHASDKQHQY